MVNKIIEQLICNNSAQQNEIILIHALMQTEW